MQSIQYKLIAVAGAVLAIPVIGAAAWLWLQWQALTVDYPFFTAWLRIAVMLLIVVFPAWYLATGAIIVWRRLGWRHSIAAHYAILMKRAETQVAPLAQHLHYEVTSTAGEAALALPAPIDVVKPMAEWLAWVDEQPHTLLGGKTRAGKTWLATALLERRIDSGSDVFILDPHSSDWMGLPTAGATATERREALKAILNEYLRRMAQREEHKRKTGHELPHDYFDPLVVLIDEANALLEEHGAEWKTVLKQISSGARKIGISLLLLAQSPLVEDLGISGAMRENFSRIALDERTVQTMIDSERDRERKQALQQAFKTMDRPAAATIGAQTWLLDRRGLQPGQASSNARIWKGWDFDRGCRVSVVPEPPTELAKTADLGTPGTGSGTTQDDVLADTTALEPLIRRMAAQQFSRNQIAAVLGGNRQKTLALIRDVLGGAE